MKIRSRYVFKNKKISVSELLDIESFLNESRVLRFSCKGKISSINKYRDTFIDSKTLDVSLNHLFVVENSGIHINNNGDKLRTELVLASQKQVVTWNPPQDVFNSNSGARTSILFLNFFTIPLAALKNQEEKNDSSSKKI
jgi:CHASE1-domain containing sensor protein